jgi:hypothetical protein
VPVNGFRHLENRFNGKYGGQYDHVGRLLKNKKNG